MQPLAGKRVVVTRFEPEDGPLAAALRRAGAEPLVVPLVGIAPLATEDTPGSPALRDFDWIAFTSANGVRMFCARLSAEELTAFRSHRGIAAVGPATARAVAGAGGNSAVTAPEFIAESLAEALGNVRGQRILWPRAAGARSALSEMLRSRGADVTERILYETIALAVPDDTRSVVLDADAITFTSPSAVRAFVACFGAEVSPRIVCIGPVTAAAARDVGLTLDGVASFFTLDGVVRALTDVFRNEAATTTSSIEQRTRQ